MDKVNRSQQCAPETTQGNCTLGYIWSVGSKSRKTIFPPRRRQDLHALLYWGENGRNANSSKTLEQAVQRGCGTSSHGLFKNLAGKGPEQPDLTPKLILL